MYERMNDTAACKREARNQKEERKEKNENQSGSWRVNVKNEME